MKYFIRLAFLGTNFYGSQRQSKDRSIQGEFEKALSVIYNCDINVSICSRLDRGVSALDYAITFTPTNSNIDCNKIKVYLSKYFKDEVFIKDVRIVDDDFSVRDCLNKTYLYIIQNSKTFNPLLSSISYISKKKLDVDRINNGCKLLIGEHNFINLATMDKNENKSSIQTILNAEAKETDDVIYIRITGKNFLRYEVRYIVAALLDYENNKLNDDSFNLLLNGESVKRIKMKMPSSGLCLEKINYKDIEDNGSIKLSILFNG